ncbi:lipocalin family protein [Pseudomonas zhanjiangensis]|uniref:Outer membrane lipoprotein Blc n=1 Tax=Pseudomonas zhanjiangensis TaxID=3239015 RepID=A0ABV3YX06_9PSED
MRLLTAFLGMALLVGCASSAGGSVPPATVARVDLQRYQGTWYELARLPMFFQRHCLQSQAHYRLLEDGSLGVRNRCRTAADQWQQVEGRAVPQQAGRTDKLWVRFDNWFSRLLPNLSRGQYWVLYLDDDYRVALVGHPNRDYLWLLARTPEVAPALRDKLLGVAREQGYDTGELIWRTPDSRFAP